MHRKSTLDQCRESRVDLITLWAVLEVYYIDILNIFSLELVFHYVTQSSCLAQQNCNQLAIIVSEIKTHQLTWNTMVKSIIILQSETCFLLVNNVISVIRFTGVTLVGNMQNITLYVCMYEMCIGSVSWIKDGNPLLEAELRPPLKFNHSA